ncbi:MAG: phage tail protein, partial [bacterium]|nr:phage tail protein [bacterium]
AEPMDFQYKNPADYPDLTKIELDIKGMTNYGIIYMLEGIENTTSVQFTSLKGYTPGATTYPNLVLHGVFNRDMRNWRDQVIAGSDVKRNMELTIRNKAGSRILRIFFYDTFPIKFSIPPLSVENNTRYMERIEFTYSKFTIVD